MRYEHKCNLFVCCALKIYTFFFLLLLSPLLSHTIILLAKNVLQCRCLSRGFGKQICAHMKLQLMSICTHTQRITVTLGVLVNINEIICTRAKHFHLLVRLKLFFKFFSKAVRFVPSGLWIKLGAHR